MTILDFDIIADHLLELKDIIQPFFYEQFHVSMLQAVVFKPVYGSFDLWSYHIRVLGITVINHNRIFGHQSQTP